MNEECRRPAATGDRTCLCMVPATLPDLMLRTSFADPLFLTKFYRAGSIRPEMFQLDDHRQKAMMAVRDLETNPSRYLPSFRVSYSVILTRSPAMRDDLFSPIWERSDVLAPRAV